MNMIALVLLAVGLVTLVGGIALMVVAGRGGSDPAATGYDDWADAGSSRTRPGLVVGGLLTTLGVVLSASGAVVLVTQSRGGQGEVASIAEPGQSTPSAYKTSAPSETTTSTETSTSAGAGETSAARRTGGNDSPERTSRRNSADGSGDGDGAGESTRSSGDLGLPTPITRPSCVGRGIVVLYSAVTPGAYASEIGTALANNPGAKYLRTDQSCPSLRPRDDNGNAIYAVYRESGYTKAELCADVAKAPGGGYGRWLDLTSDPAELVNC